MILPLWLVVSTRQMFKGHLPQFGENFNMLEKPASNYTHTGSCQNNVTVDHDRPPHTHFTNHYHPSTWLKPPASYSIYYTHKYLHESMTKHYQPSKWKTIYLANMFFFFSRFQATSHYGFHHLNRCQGTGVGVVRHTGGGTFSFAGPTWRNNQGGDCHRFLRSFWKRFWGEKSSWLVVAPTHLKKISQKWESSPNRGENEKYLKPPPRQLYPPTMDSHKLHL